MTCFELTSTYSVKVRYLNRSARQMLKYVFLGDLFIRKTVKTHTGIFKIHFDCSFLRRSLTSLYGNLLVTVWRFFALWAPPTQPFCGKRYLCRIDTLCNSQCLLGWVGLLFVLGGGSLSLSLSAALDRSTQWRMPIVWPLIKKRRQICLPRMSGRSPSNN